MSEKRKYYITTPIYYPSAKLHIGHTYCTTIADSLARFHRLRGDDVFFLTGSDEHGQKIQRAAEAKGVKPIEYVDEIVALFGRERLHLFTTKTERRVSDVKFRLGDALVFGPETRGLSLALRTPLQDRCVTLPIRKDHIRSLNLAISTGIGLYEALRQVDYEPIDNMPADAVLLDNPEHLYE